jgi:hypothetical protein
MSAQFESGERSSGHPGGEPPTAEIEPHIASLSVPYMCLSCRPATLNDADRRRSLVRIDGVRAQAEWYLCRVPL